MNWSEHTWQLAEPVYNKILQHDFIQELLTGTLSYDKFNFYILQDKFYLAEYGKVLAGIATKLSDTQDTLAFVEFARATFVEEMQLHESVLGDASNALVTEPSPTCLLYTSYLHKQLANAPIEVIVATVLPCFWIYQKVGEYIAANQTATNNPFQDWIDTYSGDEFTAETTQAIALYDKLAAQTTPAIREEMAAAYLTCSKLEWMFWDSAWKLDSWPV